MKNTFKKISSITGLGTVLSFALLMQAGSAGYATFAIKREAERRAAEAKAELKAQQNTLR